MKNLKVILYILYVYYAICILLMFDKHMQKYELDINVNSKIYDIL